MSETPIASVESSLDLIDSSKLFSQLQLKKDAVFLGLG